MIENKDKNNNENRIQPEYITCIGFGGSFDVLGFAEEADERRDEDERDII